MLESNVLETCVAEDAETSAVAIFHLYDTLIVR